MGETWREEKRQTSREIVKEESGWSKTVNDRNVKRGRGEG